MCSGHQAVFLSGSLKMAVKLTLVVGKRAGAERPVPARVEAAVKDGLLDLVERAQRESWSLLDACRVLEITPPRVY
ncbi:hypothetical protein [Nonomuraea basaltis]|uniref:hypothetical protein n=1 Tax=Nonomuraea basaltis TaxID=2495887 RepID=UPI00110C6955|nr:hypothetical protein [Nonomuraea basaltis]TMR91918.1 hypothetical protein EJK15_47415 [Nonomuraea basaltis]